MKKRNYLSDVEDRSGNAFSVIADFEGNEEQLMDIEVEEVLPILPLRNMVLFPGVFMPVSVGRKSSLKLVREAEKKNSYIAVVCQKVAETETPLFEDLHTIGTVAKIVRVLEMPDQTTTVILQGSKRMELKEITDTTPYLKGRIATLNEELPEKNDKEFHALVEACKDLTVRYIKSSDMFPQDSAFAIKNITNPMFLVDFICTNLPLKKDEKIELLRIDSLRARTYRLLEILNREVQLAEIKESIQMRAREDIDQQQREYFLQQQIKTIQDELGGGGQEQEIEEMRKKAETIKWNDEVKATFLKEVDKLERTHPQSPDYSVQLNYLQTMLSLPWGIYTTDNLSLVNAEKTLNKDHYGLEKVKERILEHLAVLKLKGDMKSPIICLYGPPGVGKTYAAKRLAYSIMGEKDVERVMMVQFHQSYSYEDFIMGYRPTATGFELKKGAFYNFCKKAEIDTDRDYFFIIDEINRGNLSKIFGELFMLIENDKRGIPLQLLYADEKFSVPRNVYLIGMMNTADRSLAMLDYALRRRFAFVDLKPGFETEGFRAYQEELQSDAFDRLIACVLRLNAAIAADESLGEGFCIGHSYFCNRTKETTDAEHLNAIVEYELIPLLREYWFDEPEKVRDWAGKLRSAIR